MPIRRLQTRKRSKVLWVGSPVLESARSILASHNFQASEAVPPTGLTHDVVGDIAALVFVQNNSDPREIVPSISTYAARLLDHGCLVFVLAWQKEGISTVIAVLRQGNVPYVLLPGGPNWDGWKELEPSADLLLPHVRIHPAEYPKGEAIASEIVQYGARHSPARDVREAFQITGKLEAPLCKKEQLMLRRSFHDCTSVHLTKLGGHSKAKAFIARATPRVEDPQVEFVESRLLPFFVKIGPRPEITNEWRNYEDYVRHQVPFHLAPRLDWGRCEVGAKLGILVGDFVDESESLSACALASRAAMVIRTLFDRTMREWQSPSRAGVEAVQGGLYRSLREWDKLKAMPAQRMSIVQELGCKATLDELIGRLRARPATEQWLRGPIHGDLHCDNVQVRGIDAILIDFLRTTRGPVLADPAALEASIVFCVPVACKPFAKDAWSEVVEFLYKQDSLRAIPEFGDPRNSFSWVADCVRQIRAHALSKERQAGQYAAVLAYRLLFISKKTDEPGNPTEEFCRAMAFCLAERLLNMVW